jgi:hypothetical protein
MMKSRAIERGSFFVAGAVCGLLFMAADWRGWTLSAEDRASYDVCLVLSNGSTVACDAQMRVSKRNQIQHEAARSGAAKWLGAGYSKRDVVQRAKNGGLDEREISAVTGIPLEDLQAGKY